MYLRMYVCHVLAVLTMLNGAGLALMTRQTRPKGPKPEGLHAGFCKSQYMYSNASLLVMQ